MCKDHDENYSDRESVLDNDAEYQSWLDERERETLAYQMEQDDLRQREIDGIDGSYEVHYGY